MDSAAVERGRYSPHWIARRAQLRIHAPARGKHGRIDFLMSDARVPSMTRFRRRVSDHGLVSFRVTGSQPGQSLHGAPVERRARPRPAVVSTTSSATCPASPGPATSTSSSCRRPSSTTWALGLRGYQLVAKPGPRGARQQVILVRRGIRTTQPRFTRMSVHGWRVVTGSRHRPAYTTFVTLDGWIGSPPSTRRSGSTRRFGRLDGPADRRRSRRGSAIRAVAAAHEATPVVAPRLSFTTSG